MNTKDLLKEAIADAKAVRETALAQAKLALEEAFIPRLTSMFNAKLQEEMDNLEEEDMIDELDEKMVDEADEAEIAKKAMEEIATMEEYSDDDNSLEEINLDEILAELDEMDNDDLKEAKEEEIEAKEDVEDVEAGAEEKKEEDKELSELTMDELEELIRDIVSQEMGNDGETEDVSMDMDASEDLPDTTDDEVVDIEEEVNLDEILAELLGEEDSLEEAKKDTDGDDEKKDDKRKKMEEELQLALEAVNTLRQELQEVNLLNAKLLYVNKIFKAKNLNESQKIKVVQAFDKAESAKEAKLVYESLNEAFGAKAEKRQIKESLGFASKPAGVAPQKQAIVESNEFIARMKKLANIK